MKYLLLTLLTSCIFIFSPNIQAQHWGIKGGLAYSNLSIRNGELDDSRGRVGYTIGAYANYPFLGIFSFQPELMYTTKGGRASYRNNSVDSRVNYLELPLGLQLNIINTVYLYAGPQLSYLTGINVDYTIGSLTIYNDKNPSNYERLDAGFFAGAGWQNDRYIIDTRITQGLVNYDRDFDEAQLPTELRNMRNFTFAITGGLKF